MASKMVPTPTTESRRRVIMAVKDKIFKFSTITLGADQFIAAMNHFYQGWGASHLCTWVVK